MKKKVQVWIYLNTPHLSFQNNYLFLILKTLPARGGFWQPVTGSVEENESIEDAAQREAEEESGLSFFEKPQSLESHFEFESRGQQVQEYGFSLQVKTSPAQNLPSVKLDPHEHSEYFWATQKEANQMIHYPSNLQMLNLLLKQLKIS